MNAILLVTRRKLEAVRAAFDTQLQEEKQRWKEEAERERAEMLNDLHYWKGEAELKVHIDSRIS